MIKLKKYLMITTGSIFLLLGVIGIFLPLLPTTPFLLLTLYFYVRSSKKMYNWILNNKFIGPYIYNYAFKKSIYKKARLFTLIFLWLCLFLSILIINNLIIKIILIFVGVGVSIHLLTLKSTNASKLEKR